MLAGATQRGVQTHLGAKIGIHRPFDPNDQETTMEGQKKKQQQWGNLIKEYLSQMNITEWVFLTKTAKGQFLPKQ